MQELRDLAAGRADLLAEVAGVIEGFSEGELDEPLARQAAGLCRDAGADPAAIPAWIEVGRERRRSAGRPPFSAARARPRDELARPAGSEVGGRRHIPACTKGLQEAPGAGAGRRAPTGFAARHVCKPRDRPGVALRFSVGVAGRGRRAAPRLP